MDIVDNGAVISELEIKGLWLTQLRWCAIALQAALFCAAKVLGVSIDAKHFLWILAALVASNFALRSIFARCEARERLLAATLCFDTLALTLLLYFYGGAANPFSMVYLAHVVLAALLLGVRWTWAMVILCASSYTALFFWYIPLAELAHSHSGMQGNFSLHLQGMLLAFVLMATVLGFFLTKIISELREKDRELGSLRLRAFQEERLASLTTLAAGAAHELNTPLGTIKLIANELARAGAENSAETVSDLETIREQVQRCEEIVRRMSARVSESAGEAHVSCTLPDLWNLVRQELGERAISRLEFSADALADAPVIPRRAVAGALAALAKNSLEASTGSSPVSVSATANRDTILFEVADTGSGMPSDLLGRIGEPFFTTKDPGKGMGLGVFLAKLLANRLGGSLTYKSFPGEGTKAIFALPNPASGGGMR